MSARLNILRALAELAAPADADAAALADAVSARQKLLDQLHTCDDSHLTEEEAQALDEARRVQAAWERQCLSLLHDVEAQQDAARGRVRHEGAATGHLVNRLG